MVDAGPRPALELKAGNRSEDGIAAHFDCVPFVQQSKTQALPGIVSGNANGLAGGFAGCMEKRFRSIAWVALSLVDPASVGGVEGRWGAAS